MDIFSAIVVVVPLITPIAAQFGVHPLHLGIIFLTILELENEQLRATIAAQETHIAHLRRLLGLPPA